MERLGLIALWLLACEPQALVLGAPSAPPGEMVRRAPLPEPSPEALAASPATLARWLKAEPARLLGLAQNSELALTSAELLLQAGQVGLAERLLDEAAKHSAGSARAGLVKARARVLLLAQRPQAAGGLLSTRLESEPGDAEAGYLAARAALLDGEAQGPERAVALLKRSLLSEPGYRDSDGTEGTELLEALLAELRSPAGDARPLAEP